MDPIHLDSGRMQAKRRMVDVINFGVFSNPLSFHHLRPPLELEFYFIFFQSNRNSLEHLKK